MINYRAPTKRAARGRLRQPYRQGDLDGLCGVYSAGNAVRALCPEVDDEAAGWIFEALMLALPKVSTLWLPTDRACFAKCSSITSTRQPTRPGEGSSWGGNVLSRRNRSRVDFEMFSAAQISLTPT